MKRKVLLVTLVLICATILPSLAKATPLVEVKLTGTSWNVDNGYYIDPYFGTVDQVPTELWCIDFSHESYLNTSWFANVTELASVSSGDSTYLKDKVRYMEMIWLITQYTSEDLANQKAIQWVIWDLSLGNQNHSSLYDQYFTWLALGQNPNNYGSIDQSGWVILTDVNRSNQEFAVRVPEPGILILLGIGLTSVALVARRKKLIP